ncbi:transcriptional repressor [Patescibacteria group bacterium]|nr:transcriptional repressor [Patescibacteria group bacterium]
MGNKIGQKSVVIQRRLTNQRTVILDYVRQQDGHLSAENVYKAVKKILPQISFATVYRNLNFLRDSGRIREMVVDKISRFEDRVDAHAHLVCESCQEIFEIDDDALFLKARRLAKVSGFAVHYENFEIRGLCRDCQSKDSTTSVHLSKHCPACGKLRREIDKGFSACDDCRVKINCRYYVPTPERNLTA